MAKDFTANLKKKPEDVKINNNTETIEQQDTTPAKKPGRPKKILIERQNINVKIPKELLEKWDQIKIVHSSNLTLYITKLIEKDLNENFEKYKKIVDSLNNLE